MKKQIIFLIFLLSVSVIWFSCEDYVTSVDPLEDRVENELLSSQEQVQFLINGVKAKFADSFDHLYVMSALLSDECFFSNLIPGATYPDFVSFDNGEMRTDMSHLDGPFENIGQLRYFSDNLIERVGGISFSDNELKEEALFTAYFYGAMARYFLATYFGLYSTQEPGGVIDGGAFIPRAQMYDLAEAYINDALEHTSDAYMIRVINSILARIRLYEADYSGAASFAVNGMIAGDEPFQALYHVDMSNSYYSNIGQGRCNGAADYRYNDYITADPAEANRIILDTINGSDDPPTLFYMQGKYPEPDSPINFVTWQENELILAECNLRGAGSGDPLTRINDVRASHSLATLAAVDMNVLILEREKELCFTGTRLIDQVRLDAEYSTWHLDASAWKFFVIPDDEINANENLN